MYTMTRKQKVQAGAKTTSSKGPDTVPTMAVSNSVMASMMGSSDQGGYAIPDLDQTMRARGGFGGLHTDMAAEQEAVEVGKQFMNSADVVRDMSNAYGEDLSSVRLHTDADANRQAEKRGVDAFSTGHDIYFAQGAFDRSDPASRGLLAHELSHSLQQGVGGENAMTQSAPMGAEQGGFLNWFKKKPKISAPQEVERREWGNDIFASAMAQRDEALKAEGADEGAVQARFLAQMNALANLDGGGKVSYGGVDYTDIRGAALHQIVNQSSAEEVQGNTALQDRIVSGFNTRMGDELAARSGRGVTDAKGAFRGNSIGEYTAYNDMLKKMVTPDMVSAMYDASRRADPTPIKGQKGATPEDSIQASSHGAPEAVQALAGKVRENPTLLRVLNNSKAAFSRSEELGSKEATSEMLMNNFALRAIGPQFAMMQADEDKSTVVRRGQAFMSEVNTGSSEAAKAYRNILLSSDTTSTQRAASNDEDVYTPQEVVTRKRARAPYRMRNKKSPAPVSASSPAPVPETAAASPVAASERRKATPLDIKGMNFGKLSYMFDSDYQNLQKLMKAYNKNTDDPRAKSQLMEAAMNYIDQNSTGQNMKHAGRVARARI